MLKKILVMLVLLTAIFPPAELRASDYNPYADSVPIPQTKEKKPALTQSEPKKDPTPKKKPAPKKPTPKKRISKPAKKNTENVSKTPKSRNYSSEKAHLRAIAKEAIKESREEKGREAAKKSFEARRKKVEEDIQKEREVHQRNVIEDRREKNKKNVNEIYLSLMDWDFSNMTVKLRNHKNGKTYKLNLEHDFKEDSISFKTRLKTSSTVGSLRTMIVSDKDIEEELITKSVKFTVPHGWELRRRSDYLANTTLYNPHTYDWVNINDEEYYNGKYKRKFFIEYDTYKSGLIAICDQLRYLPFCYSLHKASQ